MKRLLPVLLVLVLVVPSFGGVMFPGYAPCNPEVETCPPPCDPAVEQCPPPEGQQQAAPPADYAAILAAQVVTTFAQLAP